MLSRSHRVKRVDFPGFFKQGKRFHSNIATLVYSPFPTFQGSVVVSKKVAKKAVDRNRIRRQIYHLLLKHHQGNHTGVYIVVVKPLYVGLTRKQANTELEALVVRTLKSA